MESYKFPLINDDLSLFVMENDHKESFLHSVLVAFKEYRFLKTKEEQNLYILRIKEQISNSFTDIDWLHINKGHLAFVQILEMIRIVLHLIPHFLDKQDELQKMDIEHELLELLYLLVNPIIFEKDLFPKWNFETISIEYNSIQAWKDIFITRLMDTWSDLCRHIILTRIQELETNISHSDIMDSNTKNKVLNKLVFTCNQLLKYSISESFQEFRQNILSHDDSFIQFIDFYLSIISKLHIPNLCVLLLEPSIPAIFCSHPKNDSLSNCLFILVNMSSNSFQSISQKSFIQNKIIMNRIFSFNDPVIQSLLPHVSYFYI